MGKKYIIELESGTHIFVLGPEGIVHIGEPDVVYETVDGMQIGDAVINAKPYTEPDLDAIKQEEYEKGYKTAKVQCDIQTEKDLREVGERHYQKGLFDAWEAARKIWKYDTTTLRAIFGEGIMRMNWFMKSTAYEQENEEIKVGDEVDWMGDKYVVTYVRCKAKKADLISCKFGSACENVAFSALVKTGRHFPEIESVLEKMREE